MRDFELDDRFWRDALAVLQSGDQVEILTDRYPGYADLIGELALDCAAEPVLVGFRHAAADENPRLLALLSAMFIARRGRRTLLLDLDPEVRWLEQLLGEDFKEGVVDHLQFGIPLERCIRPTAVPGLQAMSGGAAFLAGSPLDDPPRFRAALLSLKQGRDAVVVALPPPAESADGSGVPALCDAVVTLEDAEGPPGPLGTERAIVRLSGDPRAARELARLCHRFLGPLPAMIGSPRPASAEPFWATPAKPVRDPAPASVAPPGSGAAPGSEELDFLSAFEGRRAAASQASVEHAPQVRLEDIVETSRARSRARRTSRSARGARHPLDRRALTLATVVLAAVAALALGSRWFAPLFAGWSGDGEARRYGAADSAPVTSAEPGTVIPLTGPDAAVLDASGADSAARPLAADSVGEPGPAAASAVPGDPAPWSVHVGSYRSVEAARGVASDLARRGMSAFLSPVVLPEKGEWVRVYVGAYDDPDEARAALSELTTSGTVADGSVRDTPLAFLLGVYPTAEEARARISELAGRGIPAYALGEGPVRVWAGAFQNEAESRLLASTLGSEGSGEPITLSRRER